MQSVRKFTCRVLLVIMYHISELRSTSQWPHVHPQCKVCHVRKLLNIRHVHTNFFFAGLHTSSYCTYYFSFYQYYPNLPLVHIMFSLHSCYALGSTEILAMKGITCVMEPRNLIIHCRGAPLMVPSPEVRFAEVCVTVRRYVHN